MRKQKILIVDDDVTNLSLLHTFLEEEYLLMMAHNGKEAIVCLENFDADLILLDWNMPVMNGLETLMFLKSDIRYRHIQVIMMTGYMTQSEDLLTAYNHGVIDFIRKPYVELELKARVKSIVTLAHYYQEEIQKKTRELTAMGLQLAKNSEVLERTVNQLDKFAKSISKDGIIEMEELLSFHQKLHNQIGNSIWQQFNDYFLQINPTFTNNLTKKYPTLTPLEIKLCVLLYLNLDTKEIASILFQTYDSIRVSRTRLRKKLSLNTEENLNSFLMSL